jgi:LemA protein
MGIAILIGSAVVLFVAGVFVYVTRVYNRLLRQRNDLDKAWANIDFLLKQRHDELPKLIGTSKGYMQHEQKTLQALTEARTAYMRASTPTEKAQADHLVSGALKTLFAVAEQYPELKANTNFVQLQGRMTELGTRIAGQRGAYNEDVNTFNIRIAQIPAKFVAGLMGLQPHALFQVGEAASVSRRPRRAST